MPSNTDAFEPPVLTASFTEDHFTRLAANLANLNDRLARAAGARDTKTLLRVAYRVADAVAVDLELVAPGSSKPITHINLMAKPVAIRPKHIDDDIADLIDIIQIDLGCAIKCSLKSDIKGMMTDLLSVALRRDELRTTAELFDSLEAKPEDKVAYGVPVTVVKCIPDNIKRISEIVETSASNVVVSPRVRDQFVMVDVLRDDDTYGAANITDRFLVSVLDQVSIVDEETLKKTYVWKD